MIKALLMILLNKDKASYDDFKKVLIELFDRNFGSLDGREYEEETYIIPLIEQIQILRISFPEYDKQDKKELEEIDKLLFNENGDIK